VLLRNSLFGYAYLLPGGPPTIMEHVSGNRSVPPVNKSVPLNVTRIDPSWTVGRDQQPMLLQRQSQHVLVFGVGALGSHVVDHLAKAGIGVITIVDPEILETQNISRHLLGIDSIDQPKADAVAKRVSLAYPSTTITPLKLKAERWLQSNSISKFDLILDLTGEHDVQWRIDQARKQQECPLLIGWMEPYVAAAHVCMLPTTIPSMQGNNDLMGNFKAVSWPDEVIQNEPGCSSRFQSYTATAAAYAVALVSEQALDMLDNNIYKPQVISWVRGQQYLDMHWPGLTLLEWAKEASTKDGLLIKRSFP